ncbi:sigma 54-interacting transcriptional regulator [Desulfobulbus rhabdoformis]|uniref:sigma 54-interacting transcriptional regulator n=1 Tax=Desulfobulbus rhabdoformis TaxID=34032 RepID=UPI0019627980|nr:sigma 54-interacting transcriptional regulator [Desulfobulbus rhabdoformis]
MTEKKMYAAELNKDSESGETMRLHRENVELRQRLNLVTSLLDNLPGMAYRCLNDENYTFEYASKGARDLFGFSAEQIVNAYAFRQLVPEEDQLKNYEVLQQLTPENDRFVLVYRMRSAQGEYRWIHERGKGLFSPEGVLVAMDGLLTDITDQKNEEIALRQENTRLRFSVDERYKLGKIIGKSQPILKVYKRIVQATGTKAPVIIHGESGTGKELAARTIHDLSDRKDKPYITVNCGAIPESLMESEFFGHVRGAFTGANTDREGHLMAANKGTLFLDEIGEMPLTLQVKLLRVLDGGGFSPVGSSKVLHSDFRLVSATNRDLNQMVCNGAMREDFYYRINTVPILMPPLRDRLDDLPILVDHFMQLYAEETGEKTQIPPHVIQKFESHDWPGNVRELINVIRRYLTLKEVSFTPFNTPAPAQEYPGAKADISIVHSDLAMPVVDDLAQFEKNMILKALNLHQWHMGNTAKALGISRRTLQRRVNKYKIK